jgi:hypothetical protein
MKKTIEFNTSTNDMSAQLTRGNPNAYEDLILVDSYRKYRHQFEAGKTKIRLLPALMGSGNWMLQIPTLQHSNGRHAHPRTIQAGARSVFDVSYAHMKEKYPVRLYSRSNKSGIRLLPSPMSLCWGIIEDANGIRLRLLLHSHYDGCRGGSNGLGNLIYDQVQRSGHDCNQPGHPLNLADGVSLCVERVGGSDTKFPSYRVSLSSDRSPLQSLLEKISEMEHNALCTLEETIHILTPEEEWTLLAKAIGDELVSEIRSAQENPKIISGHARSNSVEEPPPIDDSSVSETLTADEAAYDPEDYKDFPAKWEI